MQSVDISRLCRRQIHLPVASSRLECSSNSSFTYASEFLSRDMIRECDRKVAKVTRRRTERAAYCDARERVIITITPPNTGTGAIA